MFCNDKLYSFLCCSNIFYFLMLLLSKKRMFYDFFVAVIITVSKLMNTSKLFIFYFFSFFFFYFSLVFVYFLQLVVCFTSLSYLLHSTLEIINIKRKIIFRVEKAFSIFYFFIEATETNFESNKLFDFHFISFFLLHSSKAF